MNETQAIKKFRANNPDGFWRKLHGNKFQSSLPDIIWITNRRTLFLEFKCVDGESLPWSKCRLDQHLTMREIWKNGGTCYYMVYSNKTGHFYLLTPGEVEEGQTTKLTPAMLRDIMI